MAKKDAHVFLLIILFILTIHQSLLSHKLVYNGGFVTRSELNLGGPNFVWPQLQCMIYFDNKIGTTELFILILEQNAMIFDLILHGGTFSPAKIVHKRFSRYGNYMNWCLYLIESVYWLPRENTKFSGKPRNSSICSLRTHDDQMIIQN